MLCFRKNHCCHIKQIHKFVSNHFYCLQNSMASLFQSPEHATVYTKFRPIYPPDVLKNVFHFYEDGCKEYNFALDIGCGSGQSTRELASHFSRVTGIDVSQSQIEKAPQISNVRFMVGAAENLSFFQDNSVNLITVAQSLHWIDTDIFYPEARRVLKPNGVIAVYGYGKVALDKPEATEIISKEFHDDLLMKGGYWDDRRKYVDDLYRSYALPFKEFHRLDHLKMEKEWTLSEFIGYMTTWSGYRTYMKKHPDSSILHEIEKSIVSSSSFSQHRLLEIYTKDSGNKNFKMMVSWPIFILLGRK